MSLYTSPLQSSNRLHKIRQFLSYFLTLTTQSKTKNDLPFNAAVEVLLGAVLLFASSIFDLFTELLSILGGATVDLAGTVWRLASCEAGGTVALLVELTGTFALISMSIILDK